MLADGLGHELGIPVYLYGELAGGRTRAELRNGPGARIDAATDPDSARDLHPTAGATLVAARPPLVAFNVEVDATLEQAKDDRRARSASELRRQGARPPAHRADRIQVSTNIEDHTTTTPADVVAAVQRHATVTGAELVAPAPRARVRILPRRHPAPAPLLPLKIIYPRTSPWPRRSASAGPSTAAMPPASSSPAAAPAAGRPPRSRRRRRARARASARLNKPPTWNSALLKAGLMAGLLFVLTQIGAVRQQRARSGSRSDPACSRCCSTRRSRT